MKIKSVFCVVLALVTVFCCSLSAYAQSGANGDMNGDGIVTSADARMCLRCAVELETLTTAEMLRGDMDHDGWITAADARIILRMSVGYKSYLEECLYEVAHPQLGSYKPLFTTFPLKYFQKWCCYYTVHDVMRPMLEKAGYSEAEIDALAPNTFPQSYIIKASANGIGIPLLYSGEIYVPSILMYYYYQHPEVCTVYNFYTYYDDIMENKVIERNADDVENYEPKIGDVLFMSNKTRTYSNGYPTIDHTAQIIEVYDDGSFLCTEGSIIENAENDGIAKVRERSYHYNEEVGTWDFDYNDVVVVLTAVRPNY